MKAAGYALKERAYIGGVEPPDAFEDESRFGNDGIHTDVTWVQLPSGLWVRDCDGSLNNIDCGSDESLSNIHLPYRTLLVWAYTRSDGGNDGGRFFDKQSGYTFGVGSETVAGVLIDATVEQATTPANAITSTRLTLITWHQVVAVYNRLGTYHIEIYIDGVVQALGTDTPGVGALSSDVGQGLVLTNDGLNLPFDGLLGLFKLYNYALTEGQIASFYQAERHWFGV